MDLGLRNATVIVTGASKGIGRATALAFAEEGANVVCVARQSADLERTVADANALDGSAVGRTVDLSRKADVQALVEEYEASVEVLVNNAGAVPLGGIDLDEEVWQKSYQVKWWGHVRLLRGLLPGMALRGRGVVVSVSGLSAQEPRPGFYPSGVVNAAITNLTRGLAREYGQFGVRVVAVSPGPIATPRLDTLEQGGSWAAGVVDIPLGRIGRPEEVADAITFLASARASYITGITLPLDGGAIHGI